MFVLDIFLNDLALFMIWNFQASLYVACSFLEIIILLYNL